MNTAVNTADETEMSVDLLPMYNVPTDELLKKFPVANETPAAAPLEKKVQNRLLNGFNTWNLGYDAWKRWGEVLYTDDSMYNVHGVRLTLGEYQMAMNIGLKVADMQMGRFYNMVLVDDWTAIRYDVTTTDRRTGVSQSGTVTEFVKFADHGEHGAKVIEGWGGVKGEDYEGMQHFQTEEEKAAQKAFTEKLQNIRLPETDDLDAKYPVLYPTAIPEGDGRAMKTAVLQVIDAWNRGEDAIDTWIDRNLTSGGDFVINDESFTADTLKKRSHAEMRDFREKRVQISNILVSGDWAAFHYWATVDVNGTKDVRESMEFFHFVREKGQLKVDRFSLNTTKYQKKENKDYSKATLEERLAHHRAMAESYHAAYMKQSVQTGATYEEWKFAPHALYWSPYFGDNVIDLDKNPLRVDQSATMEATAYGVTLPDWKPLDFRCWASEDGFVMQSHFGGHDKDGVLHDFFAYGFVNTNEKDEIVRWETHVSPEYNDFLDFTLGVHGPFKNGADEYMAAVMKRLAQAGIDLSKYMG